MADDPEPSDSEPTVEEGSPAAEDAAPTSDSTGSSADDGPDVDAESGAPADEAPTDDGPDGAATGEGDARTDDGPEITVSRDQFPEGMGPDEEFLVDPDEADDDADGAARSTADGGVDAVGTEPSSVEYGDDHLAEFEREGPAEDVEMPLAEHIEEMIRRLGVVLLIAGVVAIAVFPVSEQVINYLWNTHIPGAETIVDRRPRVYGPLVLVMTKLKVSFLAGLLLGLPVFVYETYRFMRPGLYPQERRYYLAAVPTSLVLAFVGVAFAHFVVLPTIFAYFTSYTTGTAVVAFGLKETFNLILLLMGYMAVVFQIPLFIQLGSMMNLVTRSWLERRRLLFWGGFAGLAFLVSPDPTGMAPIIVTATMIVLFEGTLALLRWTGN
ncbi:MAG: twin-arginine translocase subunit TatC [Haloferacaceae archaeon]